MTSRRHDARSCDRERTILVSWLRGRDSCARRRDSRGQRRVRERRNPSSERQNADEQGSGSVSYPRRRESCRHDHSDLPRSRGPQESGRDAHRRHRGSWGHTAMMQGKRAGGLLTSCAFELMTRDRDASSTGSHASRSDSSVRDRDRGLTSRSGSLTHRNDGLTTRDARLCKRDSRL